MLKTAKTFSSFSVNDIKKAREFYGQTLGLDNEERMGMMQLNLAGGSQTFVYSKPDHVAATFTVLNFVVVDVEKTVDEITAAGVTFEQYDMPEIKTDAKGIARGHGQVMAWFKDPAGNILSLVEKK